MPQVQGKTAAMKHENKAVSPRRRVDEVAEARLQHAKYVELRAVSCEFHEGVLTLRGRVPSYYLKQLAQSLLDSIPGVLQLDNQLEVGGLRLRDARPSRPPRHAAPAPRRPR